MEELIKLIDEKIEEYTEKLTDDTVRLVRINSEQGRAEAGAPFGIGPRKVLDTVLEMAKDEGFYTKDFGVGVVSVSPYGTDGDLGIWAHGDVVPAGDGWVYPPYGATLYKGCVIGRGATDNKGQLAAIFNLFKIFKEMGITLSYIPALYVGSNEETGMKDMVGVENNPDARGFVNVCKMPKMSLVPDSGFPVAYGARGLTSFKLKSKTKLCGFSFTAGQNDAPGLATAIFDTKDFPDELENCTVTKGEKTRVTAFTPPRHTANPDESGNMITFLSSALIRSGAVREEDKYILEFLRDVSLDVYGKNLGIYTESKLMRPTSVFAQTVDFEDGYCTLTIKVRYPIEISYDEMRKILEDYCEKRGFTLDGERGHLPYVNDENPQIAELLASIANSITGDTVGPFICGSTYAHYLPNAYVYGMNGCKVPEGFPEGHGGAHGLDECVSIERLKRAMRIYARALLALDGVKW